MGPIRPLGLLLLLWPQVFADEGILHAIDDDRVSFTKDYCITYNSTWTTLPATVINATYFKLENLSSLALCSDIDIPKTGIQDKAVAAMDSKCAILQKAGVAQRHGAKMLIVISKDGLVRIEDRDLKIWPPDVDYLQFPEFFERNRWTENHGRCSSETSGGPEFEIPDLREGRCLPCLLWHYHRWISSHINGSSFKLQCNAQISLQLRPTGNRSKFENITIPIVYLSYENIIRMNEAFGRSINVTLYSPLMSQYDYSLLIIFLISVFTVALGGYWSGLSELAGRRYSSDSRSNTSLLGAGQGGNAGLRQGQSEDLRPSPSSGDVQARKQKDDNVTFTPITVVLFFVICCVMLLLLYYFYQYLVYVIIAVFCLASAMSLFNCLSALIEKIPYGRCRWIWILQDILGIAFCLNFIKTLRMPNFKACVILLGLLLVYDVFFVFITPFLTKNGESIMVEVAAGPSGSSEKNGDNLVEVPAESYATREKLPVVIRVPRLEYSASTLCGVPTSVLGFGDIIVPGLLVAYCRRFDVRTTSSSVYYICCTIAYAVGMVITFVVLMVMKSGQPALLYLVPCTLVTCSVIAWIRKEMKKFWNGGAYEIMEHTDNAVNEENAACVEQESQ
uniref:Signal peptide peptidase like 2A n=1 Tax=Leptobrachium leishanense TaxID=445787 RepID=A0A8C5MAC9_9ANUR